MPGLVVLGDIKRQAEQTTRGKPVSSAPMASAISSCLQVPTLLEFRLRLSSATDYDLRVMDEVNPFLPKLL